MVNGRGVKRKAEIRPPLQMPRYDAGNIPDPSVGGNGYSEDTRRAAVSMYNDIGDGIDDVDGMPSSRTVRRFKAREALTGRNVRMHHTGNKRSQSIAGFPLFLLAMYRLVFPKASRGEVAAFLFRSYYAHVGGGNLIDLSEITRAENSLGMSRKVGSTSAFEAFTERNLMRRFLYWNASYPHGIADVRREDLIDIDEAGIKLKQCGRTRGKARLQSRIRQRGHYGNDVQYTLKMCIGGGPDGLRWFRFDQAGTDIHSFVSFMEEILTDLPQGTPNNRKTFIMDNLIIHHTPIIHQMITNAGHRLVFRAPYWPKDAPIEYVFNTIEMALAYRCHLIDNVADMNIHIAAIIRGMVDFEAYFEHCGYRN